MSEHFKQLLDRLRRNPKKHIWPLLFIVAEKLVEHRALEWANRRIDEGAGRLMPVVRDILQLSATRFWTWVAVVVGVYCFGLVVWAYGSMAVWNYRYSRRQGLDYVGWFGGGTIGCASVAGGTACLIEVCNLARAVPVPAHDVIASAVFENADRSKRFVVPLCSWWQIKQDGSTKISGWESSIDVLEGGESQYFVLFVTIDKGMVALRLNQAPVGLIDYGEWTIKIRVESSDVEGFEGEIKFMFSRDGGFQGNRPFFTMRRRLSPRFSRA